MNQAAWNLIYGASMLLALADVLTYRRRFNRLRREYRSPCGSTTHEHRTVITSGGQPAAVCEYLSCGDNSHPHVSAVTTADHRVIVCMTKATTDRYRQIALLRKAFPVNPPASESEEKP